MRLVRSFVVVLAFIFSVAGAVAPVAADSAFAEGDLLRASGDDKIYVMQGGQRHWIADTTSLKQINPDFGRLRQLAFHDVDRIAIGKPIHAGPVIRDSASGNIYLLTKETDWPAARKHWINNLDSFTRLGFTWDDVRLDWPTTPDAYADAPALGYLPVLTTPVPVTSAPGALMAIPAWQLQVQDDRLFQAMALVETYNLPWRDQVGSRFWGQGTFVVWGTLPDLVDGAYNTRTNRITINPALQIEPIGVLAATMAHEAFHATTSHGTDPSACYAEEASAFVIEAQTWTSLPAQYRSAAGQATARGQFEDTLAAALREQGYAGVLKAVTNSAGYQRECSPAAR